MSRAESLREWRKKNPERSLEYSRKWRANNLEHMREWQRKWRADNNYDIKRRGSLVQLLGGKCSNPNCLVPGGCTDIRCLQIDHINGGGTKELKKGPSVYGYYLRNINEAKQKLQILCANCNWIKRYEKNEMKCLMSITRDANTHIS